MRVSPRLHQRESSPLGGDALYVESREGDRGAQLVVGDPLVVLDLGFTEPDIDPANAVEGAERGLHGTDGVHRVHAGDRDAGEHTIV